MNRRELNHRRWYYLAISACFAGTGVGVSLGSLIPTFPERPVWAAVSFTTAAVAVAYIIRPTDWMLRLSTGFIVVAASSRVVGAALFAINPATRWAATSVWALVAVLALQVHRLQRR